MRAGVDDFIPMDPKCPRCSGKHGVEVAGDGYDFKCAACGGHLMCAIGPDGGEMYPWDEDDADLDDEPEPNADLEDKLEHLLRGDPK